jgi:phosphate transport system substrate-binding protein
LAVDAESEAIPATAEHAYTGDYPLSRFLYVYVNARPDSELEPLQREFIRYVFSQEGQAEVVKDGYYPVTADIARETLEAVGITSEATAATE